MEIVDAAERGDFQSVKTLLDDGVDPDSQDEDWGFTALHSAAGTGRQDIAEILLAKSANVNAMDKTGATPLHEAAKRGHLDCAKLLIKHGADINRKTFTDKMTPFEMVLELNPNEEMERLLSQTAKPSPQFNQTKATEGLSERFVSLCKAARDGTLEPQLWLRCKRISMALALASFRPSSTESYLVGTPDVVEDPDGSGAIVFRVRNGNDLLPLVQCLFEGNYGNANVEVTNGLAAHLPEHQQKALLAMVGATQGMRVGNAVVW